MGCQATYFVCRAACDAAGAPFPMCSAGSEFTMLRDTGNGRKVRDRDLDSCSHMTFVSNSHSSYSDAPPLRSHQDVDLRDQVVWLSGTVLPMNMPDRAPVHTRSHSQEARPLQISRSPTECNQSPGPTSPSVDHSLDTPRCFARPGPGPQLGNDFNLIGRRRIGAKRQSPRPSHGRSWVQHRRDAVTDGHSGPFGLMK